jgi:D-tyrosyl-tRNA(Tyr) deacylase
LLLLVGVTGEDTTNTAKFLAEKTANLRIFDDEHGVMNRSALDLLHDSGDSIALLVVSQFTLYADCRKGRRPSYIRAAVPDVARPLVDHFADCLRALGLTVETGEFGAEMAVELVNDGPVTILLDSDELRSTV